MTWVEWCESEYNADGYICENGYVHIYPSEGESYNVVVESISVGSTDEIVSGMMYEREDLGLQPS